MKLLVCCLSVLVLSGCIPIGIQANTRAINASDRADAPGRDIASAPALY